MGWRTKADLAWLASLAGVEADHPLARHTTFNIGGPAEHFVEARSAGVLVSLVAGAAERGIPYLLLGAGTNLLVADGGVEGLVIRAAARGHRVEGSTLWAEGGLKMMRLARIAADAGLVGFEFAIGIPGTIGGAVYQDAGCWGREVRDVLVEAEGFVPGRGPVRWRLEDMGLGYRTSAFRDGNLEGALISAATFRLEPGDGRASRRRMAELIAERARSQPIATRNCGSVFRNPPGDSAGRLVEAAGMKGAVEGAARVSEVHANFIVNGGGATAQDVARLIERIQAEVGMRFEVELEPEVEMVGRW
ncbi:MAG: UDP-N-acetylmuramate dehydrogenase [Candidatus Dormibacteraceae bacterium]